VFEALVDDAPDRLDETAARVRTLRAEGLGGRQPDDVVTGAVGWIGARPAAAGQVD
jgi:hypothetical protein